MIVVGSLVQYTTVAGNLRYGIVTRITHQTAYFDDVLISDAGQRKTSSWGKRQLDQLKLIS